MPSPCTRGATARGALRNAESVHTCTERADRGSQDTHEIRPNFVIPSLIELTMSPHRASRARQRFILLPVMSPTSGRGLRR